MTYDESTTAFAFDPTSEADAGRAAIMAARMREAGLHPVGTVTLSPEELQKFIALRWRPPWAASC